MADVNPRERVRRAARELAEALAIASLTETIEVTEVEDRVTCCIRVWNSSRPKRAAGGGRAECRADILEAVRGVGRALTFKEIVRELRESKKGHGPGTITKALAEMTKSGELVNPKDKKGYRLGGWRKTQTPSLFD